MESTRRRSKSRSRSHDNADKYVGLSLRTFWPGDGGGWYNGSVLRLLPSGKYECSYDDGSLVVLSANEIKQYEVRSAKTSPARAAPGSSRRSSPGRSTAEASENKAAHRGAGAGTSNPLLYCCFTAALLLLHCCLLRGAGAGTRTPPPSVRAAPKRSASVGSTHSRAQEEGEHAYFGSMGTFTKRVVPCMSYGLSSVFMTLVQKFVVMNAPETKALFLFYQNLAALILWIPSNLGWLRRFAIEPYSFWQTSVALQVAPLGVTYSVMLYSSNCALELLTVPMVSVLKNVGPILITLIEASVDKKPVTQGLLLSMCMLVLGSLVAGYNDLRFSAAGYGWMGVNVGANVCHVMFMRRMMQRGQIPKAVVLHYQSIAMCLLLLPKLFGEDVARILRELVLQRFTVLLAFISTGINGVVIALCTMWAIEATSGSTYSMVGALTKIPSSILGIFIFNDPINLLNLMGVAIGLAGGIVFSLDRAGYAFKLVSASVFGAR